MAAGGSVCSDNTTSGVVALSRGVRSLDYEIRHAFWRRRLSIAAGCGCRMVSLALRPGFRLKARSPSIAPPGAGDDRSLGKQSSVAGPVARPDSTALSSPPRPRSPARVLPLELERCRLRGECPARRLRCVNRQLVKVLSGPRDRVSGGVVSIGAAEVSVGSQDCDPAKLLP